MSDSTSNLDTISASQAQKEVTANALFDAQSPNAMYGRRASTTSALTWGYYGGRWDSAAIANGTVALTGSTTNYVVCARATGAVSVSTASTNWNDTPNYMRLYKIVTGVSTVTSYEDHRQSYISSAGAGPADVVGPASSVDNTLVRFSGTTGKIIQTSGVLVSDSDEISGYKGDINEQTGTSYVLVAADTGKIVECTNGSAITVVLANELPVGFCCTVVQGGAGQITLSPESDTSGAALLRNRQSHTKTAGQYAGVTLYVRTNSGGFAAEYVMLGDTAA